MNSVHLAGRISNKFDIREYGKGKEKTKVIQFSVAVQRNKDEADFIQVKAFNSLAELVDEYFDKGDQIIIEASLRTGSYETDDGDTIYTLETVANRIEFGAKKKPPEDEKKGAKKGK